ncbi:MAG: cytochrome c3 family protein, partial [Solirubrobacterales bacterium]
MRSGRYRPKTVLALVACTVAIVAVSLLGAYYPGNLGSAQPISFSHRVHAGDKEIGCLMCHPNVFTSQTAGMPPAET